MVGVLEKHLSLAIDKRLAVFKSCLSNGSILQDEMKLRTVAYLISELVQPCCCMLCNKERLKALLAMTECCSGNDVVIERLSCLVYDDLARCNGLG